MTVILWNYTRLRDESLKGNCVGTVFLWRISCLPTDFVDYNSYLNSVDGYEYSVCGQNVLDSIFRKWIPRGGV